MGGDAANSYDVLPYQGQFIPMTHPDRMATMAVLHGMKPPPVERCRVLELGCTDGGNLLTIAQALPEATFLGLDLSRRQITEGLTVAQAIGADNVELRALDLTEVNDTFGLFDYIICHGVYSWVPESIRRKILQICSRNLASNGVAYLSYNTYPGWFQQGMVRHMLLYHTRGIAEPVKRVQQARALLDFVAREAKPQDGPYAQYLLGLSERFAKFPDTYLFHDYLEEENQPLFFHEIVARAADAGLQYLSHSVFRVEDTRLSAEFQQVIDRLGPDFIRREQYVDFVLNRGFRQSLFCQTGAVIHPSPTPEAVRSLRLIALARPEESDPELGTRSGVQFLTMHGDRLTVDEPLIKAALFALYQRWPLSLGFDDLWGTTREILGRSGTDTDTDRAEFAAKLLRCHLFRLLDLHTFDLPIATDPGQRPRASALARRNAAEGRQIVSLRHHLVTLDKIDLLVIPSLDGTRDEAAIVDQMAALVAEGKLQLSSDSRPISGRAAVHAALGPIVQSSLRRIADQALLMAD
jgi:SAM-dependent methyltransferase